MAKAIEVVGGIIRRGDKYLLGKRPLGKAQGGHWEFIGGKIEPGETPEQALARECREEIALEIVNEKIRTSVTHAYPEKTIHLTLIDCEPAPGAEPQALEHAELGWFTPTEMQSLDFCPADAELLQVLFTQEDVGFTQPEFGQLMERLCREWAGCDFSKACASSNGVPSLWNTGMFARLCVARENDTCAFYMGVRPVEADGDKQVGVLVWLHDSWGALGLRIKTVGSCKTRLSYENQFNEANTSEPMPVDKAFNQVRSIVEMACGDLTRELSADSHALRCSQKLSMADVDRMLHSEE